MLVASIALLLGCQEPTPAPAPAPQVPAPAPAVIEWNDREARDALSAFQKAIKGSASLADKMRALDELAKGSHKSLVKPLATVVQSEKLVVVRRRAAELLGQQPERNANPVILQLLGHTSLRDERAVQAELVRSLSRTGYHGKQWQHIDDLFEREYSLDTVVLQDALLDLIIAHKETQSVDILLRNIDPPQPVNVDDPTNPPAEYWKARWEAWSSWRGKVKEALFAITGQRFSTAEEARAWLRKNPLK